MEDEKTKPIGTIYVLGWTISITAVFLFFFLAWRALPTMSAIAWTPQALSSLVAATLLIALNSLGPAARLWGWLVHKVLKVPEDKSLWAVLWISQFAKYIPGNILHHLGRTELSRQLGLSVPGVAGLIVIETILVLIIPLCMALAWWWHPPTGLLEAVPALNSFSTRVIGALVTAVMVGAGTLLLLRQTNLETQSMKSWFGIFFKGIGYTIVMFALLISSVISIAKIGLNLDIPYFALTQAIILSWVAGMVTPGAPAGIGVREVVFIGLLSGTTSIEHATLLSILSRIAQLGGDLLVFLVGLSFWRTRSHRI